MLAEWIACVYQLPVTGYVWFIRGGLTRLYPVVTLMIEKTSSRIARHRSRSLRNTGRRMLECCPTPLPTSDLPHFRQIPLRVTLRQLYVGDTFDTVYVRQAMCAGASQCEKKCKDCAGPGIAVRMHQLGPGFVQQVQVRVLTAVRHLALLTGHRSSYRSHCSAHRYRSLKLP